jgi:hypothetical protein
MQKSGSVEGQRKRGWRQRMKSEWSTGVSCSSGEVLVGARSEGDRGNADGWNWIEARRRRGSVMVTATRAMRKLLE